MEYSLRNNGAGRLGSGAGHRGAIRGDIGVDVAAGTAQRAGTVAVEIRSSTGRGGVPAGPAVPWHRPAPRTDPRLGPDRRRRRARQVLRRLCGRRSPILPWSSRRSRSSRRSARRFCGAGNGQSARCRPRGCWCWPTPNAGDIGSTMAAYADAWAGDSPLAADAVTASPYLGFGSLQPLSIPHAHGRGVFVLAATSNPEAPACSGPMSGAGLSRNRSSTPPPRFNRESSPEPGSVGVVVGATVSDPPTSARCVVRSWYRESARRADGPKRSAALAGLIPGSCCRGIHAMCCGPAPMSPPFAPR